MTSVTVRLPAMLAAVGDGRTIIPVDADTVRGALEAVFEVLPQLRVHLFDESRQVRPHVAIFHRGRRVGDSPGLAAALSTGDVVTVLQAVSGG